MRWLAWIVSGISLTGCARDNPKYQNAGQSADASSGSRPTGGTGQAMTAGTRTAGADATSAHTSGATSSNATSSVTSTPPPPTGDNGVDTHPSEESSGLPNACCLPHGAPGCANPGVQMCVCEFESDCCETEGGWDQDCVELVDVLGCGDCGLPAENCCQFPGPPNCGVPVVDNCVCELDFFCCDPQGGWDLHCVALAVTECGAYCPAPFGNCCEPGQYVGCDDWDVVACVCSADLNCCTLEWAQEPCVVLADACLDQGCDA